MKNNIEKIVLDLIAADRLDISLSSMHQKLAKKRKRIAHDVAYSIKDSYSSERVFADVITEENNKARGYVGGVAAFSEKYPQYGRILKRMIEKKRTEKDRYLEFGMNTGKKLALQDYVSVMTGLGLTGKQAIGMYPGIVEASRKLQNARNETRSVLL